MKVTMTEMARQAYEAYAGHVGWQNIAGGAGGRIPAWDDLPAKIKDAWVHAAARVVMEFQR